MYAIPKDVHPELFKAALDEKLKKSRFFATTEVEMSPSQCRGKHVVRVTGVRLRRRKDYCGQHSNACVFPRKHKKMSYLEGGDWVAFDDLLNDLCDERGWDCYIWSKSMEFKGKLVIRRGRERRINYPSEHVREVPGGSVYSWDTKYDPKCFADRVGKESPRSAYPEGTPGIPEWDPEKADEYVKEHAEEFAEH